MKRVWKPLDVGGYRLYKVTVKYYTREGRDLHQAYDYLVIASRPKHAASLLQHISDDADDGGPIRVECKGEAVQVLMPKSWREHGIPSELTYRDRIWESI